ncbi:MAG TPA: LUD domain-containing protein [Chitinophagaceae bacterium]|nr:LUD domain-containing protein [Chitinophagaceae bacterium]
MNAREHILQAIKAGRPGAVALPGLEQDLAIHYDDVLAKFKTTLEAIGGQWLEISGEEEVSTFAEQESGAGKFVINAAGDNENSLSEMTARQLAGVDMAIVRGKLGVAENAAIWLTEEQMKNRLLPYICQQLVLVLREDEIISNMHQAYQQTRINERGFGAFIAGPSKTADIEQSLVIGAHGPISLKVLIIKENKIA